MADSIEPHRSGAKPAAASKKEKDKDKGKAQETPEVHTANTHVTIAWPFSQIKLQEASAELGELADLLSELVEALAGLVPEDRLGSLRERAEELRTRLR